MKNTVFIVMALAVMVWSAPVNTRAQEAKETTGDVVNAVQDVMAPKPPPPSAEKAAAETEYMDSMPQDEVDAEIAKASKPEATDPSMKLQALIDDFETNGLGRRFLARRDEQGFYYTIGRAVVRTPDTDKSWVDHRVSAFREALVNAEAQYLAFLNKDIRTSIVKSVVQDSRLPEFTEDEVSNPSKLGSLLDKLVALGGGVLDNKLKEMGIDPSEYDAAPPSKKKLLMMNAIGQETMVRSMAKLAGVIPVKTFEAYDENGNFIVAVAIVASAKSKAFARNVLENRERVKPNPLMVGGPTVRDQILGDKEALLQEFGIRKIYDKDGYPVLISYGQSGNEYVGDDFQMKMHYREIAFDFAKNQALANFALLMDAYGNAFTSTTEYSQTREIATAVLNDDAVFTRQDTIKDMIKVLESQVDIQGAIHDFPGIYELSRWSLKHPLNGHEVNGVVYAWSPRSASLAEDMKKEPQPAASMQPERQSAGTSGGAVSKDLMSPDDF